MPLGNRSFKIVLEGVSLWWYYFRSESSTLDRWSSENEHWITWIQFLVSRTLHPTVHVIFIKIRRRFTPGTVVGGNNVQTKKIGENFWPTANFPFFCTANHLLPPGFTLKYDTWKIVLACTVEYCPTQDETKSPLVIVYQPILGGFLPVCLFTSGPCRHLVQI